jgi:RHS repeat-associated protein
LRQVNGANATNRLAWGYDNLGRLTNEMSSSTLAALNFTNKYVYNLVGNRLWQTNIAGAVTTVIGCTYNTNDQLLVESGSGSFTNWYDVNGSLTNRTSGVESNGYAYNLQNRLATATISRTDSGHSISETINFTYDYSGKRVRAQWSRSVDGGAAVNGTNIFLHEPNSPAGMSQILEELPAVGAAPTVSYTLGGRVVTQSKGGTISHLLPDGHGSTRQLADTNGNIAVRYTYDAYGKGLDFTNNTQSPTATALLYSGGQLDLDLQLYNLNARYYNPVVGRFNQIDPFGPNQQSGANLYAYCQNDPVNNSDPSGLYEIDVHQYLTRYLAEKVGFADAQKIGLRTQEPDEDNRSAIYWQKTWGNMAKHHFVDRNRLRQMAGDIGSDTSYVKMGEFLHAQEDTYAHCTGQDNRNWDYLGGPNGGVFGHACDGHDPDHTWLKPEKAVMMTMRVYIDLKNLKKFGNALNNDTLDDVVCDPDPAKIDWSSDDCMQIAKFIWFNPGNVKGGMTKTGFGWDTVTQAGYLARIQVLFPGYSLKEADAGYLKKLTPVKPLLSPRMQGMTTDMTVSGIVGGFAP